MVFSWVIVRVKYFGIYRVRTLFLPVDPNWQVHTQHCLALNIHTWERLNLSIKEVVWTGGSLGGEWHIHTIHYKPRDFIRWVHSKEVQAQCFLQKSDLLVTRTDQQIENQHPKCLLRRVWQWKLLSSSWVRSVSAGRQNWLVHTQHIILQCPSTKNALRMMELSKKGSCVNSLFCVSWEAYPHSTSRTQMSY